MDLSHINPEMKKFQRQKNYEKDNNNTLKKKKQKKEKEYLSHRSGTQS